MNTIKIRMYHSLSVLYYEKCTTFMYSFLHHNSKGPACDSFPVQSYHSQVFLHYNSKGPVFYDYKYAERTTKISIAKISQTILLLCIPGNKTDLNLKHSALGGNM